MNLPSSSILIKKYRTLVKREKLSNNIDKSSVLLVTRATHMKKQNGCKNKDYYIILTKNVLYFSRLKPLKNDSNITFVVVNKYTCIGALVKLYKLMKGQKI